MSNMAYILAGSTDVVAALNQASSLPVSPRRKRHSSNILLNDFASINNSCRRIVIDDMGGAVSLPSQANPRPIPPSSARPAIGILQTAQNPHGFPPFTRMPKAGIPSLILLHIVKICNQRCPLISLAFTLISRIFFTYMSDISASFLSTISPLFDILRQQPVQFQNTDVFASNPEFGDIYGRIHAADSSSYDYFTLASGKTIIVP